MSQRKHWLNLWVLRDCRCEVTQVSSVFPLDQLLGCFCQTFTFFHPLPTSVCDLTQPRKSLNIALRFFVVFFCSGYFDSREWLPCTSPYGAETAGCPTNIHPSRFFPAIKPGLFNSLPWPGRSVWLPRVPCSQGYLSDVVLPHELWLVGSSLPSKLW